MTRPDLAILSQRIVTPDGIRPGAVLVKDGSDLPASSSIEDAPARIARSTMWVRLSSCRASWTPTSTSTSRAEPSGKASPSRDPRRGRGRRHQPSSTCRSTAFRRPRRSTHSTRSCARRKGSVSSTSASGEVVVPGNEPRPAPRCSTAGVLGFKCFLVPSGVDEFPVRVRARSPTWRCRRSRGLARCSWCTRSSRVRSTRQRRLPPLRRRRGTARPSVLRHVSRDTPNGGGRRGDRTSSSGCVASTAFARTSCTCRRRLPLTPIAAARADGLPVTVETCPHYLAVLGRRGPRRRHRLQVRAANSRSDAISRGTLGGARRGHDRRRSSPITRRRRQQLKNIASGNFLTAWGGIASLQLGSADRVDGSPRARPFRSRRPASWMSAAPARLAGLDRKGAIDVGRDADLVIFDPDAEFIVDPTALFHRHPLTPYRGQRLRGDRQADVSARTEESTKREPFGSASAICATGMLLTSPTASRRSCD